MSLSEKEVEILHEKGLMPDWAWIQQNGRTAQENYEYQRSKFKKQIDLRQQIADQEKAIDELILQGLDKALKDLFKSL